MNNTFYFSHDYATREDEKIKNLIFRHGLFGYGLYWVLVESLYQNDGIMTADYDRIAYELKIEKKIVESVINDFKLFQVRQKKFFSPSISRRLKLRKQKSLKAKKSANARWLKPLKEMRTHNERITNAKPSQSDRNAIKERKGKERKVNKDESKTYKTSVAIWLDFYLNKTKNLYIFSAKDGASVKKILANLEVIRIKNNIDMPAPEMFGLFLAGINDKYILSHLSLTLVSSQFNQILQNVNFQKSNLRKGENIV